LAEELSEFSSIHMRVKAIPSKRRDNFFEIIEKIIH
jgi:hypothetical protein